MTPSAETKVFKVLGGSTVYSAAELMPVSVTIDRFLVADVVAGFCTDQAYNSENLDASISEENNSSSRSD